MVLVPITKKMEIMTRIQVCLISQTNFNYKENSGKKSFFSKSKLSKSCIPMRGTWLLCPSQKEWGLLREYKLVSFHRWMLIIRKMVERKAFLANPKHQNRVPEWGEHDCCAHKKKKWRLLWASKFVSFHGWTLIVRKIGERKAFLANPKHQDHVSQYG